MMLYLRFNVINSLRAKEQIVINSSINTADLLSRSYLQKRVYDEVVEVVSGLLSAASDMAGALIKPTHSDTIHTVSSLREAGMTSCLVEEISKMVSPELRITSELKNL